MHKTERASATGIVKRRMVVLCYVDERMKEWYGMDKGVGLVKEGWGRKRELPLKVLWSREGLSFLLLHSHLFN